MADSIHDPSRPHYPAPSPAATTPPDRANIYELGSGSEVRSASMSEQASDTARELAERARDGFRNIAGQAREQMNEIAGRASSVADDAAQRISSMRDQLEERLPVWKQEARERVEDARIVARNAAAKADRKARQYPLQTIAAAAGAALIVGASLHIWRSSRG